MRKLVLNEQQAKLLANSNELIEFVDERGNLIGCFTRAWTPTDVEEALKRREHKGHWLTTDEVLSRLRPDQ